MATMPVVHDTPQDKALDQLKLTGWKSVVLTLLWTIKSSTKYLY